MNTDIQKVLARLQKCKDAIARNDLPNDAKVRWVENYYYWLGWLDAANGEKP
jgi:hypothetical protein